MVLYSLLKMIHGGIIHNDEKYIRLLQQNKYYIIPTVNIDGLQYIEDQYLKTGIIEAKRTNMHVHIQKNRKCNDTEAGVDLNRNYAYKYGIGSQGKECSSG